MTIPATIVGTKYSSTQVSEGTVGSTTGPIITFTETQPLSSQKVFGTPIGTAATATVIATGTDSATGNPTLTVQIDGSGTFADGQTIKGVVVGNDATDLLLYGNLFGTAGYLYVTNTAAQQPGPGGSALIATEAAGVPYTTPACFCPGTLILTERGERPVEALAIGDVVITASGAHRPIKWLGRRSYAGRFLLANPDAQPIRFRAGSLGHGLPRRDLRVSAEHAMFLAGVLVPARQLVNGSTVVREEVERVEYRHVELDTHDLLLAEGAPSESFRDNNSRGIFHNAAEFDALYPDAVDPAAPCAPLVDDGFALDMIRRRLAHAATAAAAA